MSNSRHEESGPRQGRPRASTNLPHGLPGEPEAAPADHDPFDLEDRHAAWLAGYDLGLIDGRAQERAVIGQEWRSARAGAVVAMLATYPEEDPKACRRRAEAREARWAS